MAIPTVVSCGTLAAGTGDVSPAWGTHNTGDLGLLFVESFNQAVATPTDWIPLPGSPAALVSSTRLTGFYRFATSAAESAPLVTDPGDHVVAVILTLRGTKTTNPFNTASSGASGGSTTIGICPGLLTTANECLIVGVMAYGVDSAGPISSLEANATLASVTEQHDAGSVDGNGGGIIIITGTKAIAGFVDMTTSTVTSTGYASMTFAVQSPEAAGVGYSRARVVNQ